MRRYAAFDPPEYVAWKPDPALVRQFRATIEAAPERGAIVATLSVQDKLGLYAGLLRARLHDIQLQRWVKGGVISKAWLGAGEEAAPIWPVQPLEGGQGIAAPRNRDPSARCQLR